MASALAAAKTVSATAAPIAARPGVIQLNMKAILEALKQLEEAPKADQLLLRHFQTTSRDVSLDRSVTETFLNTIIPDRGFKCQQEVMNLFQRQSKENWEKVTWAVLHIDVSAVARDALACLEEGAKNGYAVAQYALGLFLQEGIGTTKNAGQAFSLYQAAEKQGHLAAKYQVGYCLHHGEGVPADRLRALTIYKEAAERGHATAQFVRGTSLMTGKEKNESEGIALLERSAKQGNPWAFYVLGDCLVNGRIVQKDAAAGNVLLLRAVKKGVRKAALPLAHNFLNGIGIQKDELAAIELYQVDGSARAKHIHASLLMRGGTQVPADKPRAMVLYEEAYKAGELAAGYFWGISFIKGDGVPIDEGRGYRIIEEVANKGYADAQFLFASHLLKDRNGDYTDQGSARALTLIEAASKQGHVKASEMLPKLQKAIGRNITAEIAEDRRKFREQFESNIREGLRNLNLKSTR